MTNRRKYWLTEAIASLREAYDRLGEAANLIPEDENFDAAIDQHQQLIDDLIDQLAALNNEVACY
jgi:hypothetical protein